MKSGAEFQKRLGARIREIRTARGFSQESFAEACELHRTHVSLLERGRINVTVNTTRQIAHVLQISVSERFAGWVSIEPPATCKETPTAAVRSDTTGQINRGEIPLDQATKPDGLAFT